MAEQKDFLGKLFNGKSTSVAAMGILVVLGLNSLGIGVGGSTRPVSREDVKEIVLPLCTKIDDSLNVLRQISENNVRSTMVLQQLLEELKEQRRKP